MPPSHVGPYEILGTLGRGGIGTVYRARDSRSQEEVALKLLSTGAALDPIVAKRLVREFEALAELSHPNVVRVFDAGVYHGYPYLAMELIEGLDLRRYLTLDLSQAPQPSVFRRDDPSNAAYDLGADDEGSTPGAPAFGMDSWMEEPDTDSLGAQMAHPRGRSALRAYAAQADEPDTFDGERDDPVHLDAQAAAPEPPPGALPHVPLEELNEPERIGRLKDALVQICEALAYVHARGLIHRDLKPGNILVDEDRRVKLMDFGLAKFLADEGSVTATGKVVGTYRYMAPEQAMGEAVDGRADLYSLGVIVYELLAGRPPYDARTPAELWQEVLEHEPASLFALNPDVDAALARLAHRLLRKDPDERYQTAEEVFDLLLAG